eukprot:g17886.t1
MLNGFLFMMMLVFTVCNQVPTIFSGVTTNIPALMSIYFFALTSNTSFYGSRTIRLAVLYSPKARKAMPWLISERNHVIGGLLLGAAATAIPLYDISQVDDGPSFDIKYFMLARKHLWLVIFTSQAIVLLLNPIAWYIDDIFGIGPELRVMMVVQLISVVTSRIAEEYASPELLRWVDAENLGFLGTLVMLSITIIAPITRRLLYPLESSDPRVIKALQRRKAHAALKGTSIGPSTSGQACSSEEDSDVFFYSSTTAAATQPSPAASSPGSWTYERVMETPQISAAFEAFSKKALCQESFLFLKAATKFQAHRSADVEAGFADDAKTKDEDGDGYAPVDSEGRRSGKSGEEVQDQFMLFSEIVREYIVDGAPNEINISWKDKNDILELYNNKRAGDIGFRDLPASERRLVFARAYAEIRFMLESNLMMKFVSTTEFHKALTAALQHQAKD